MKKSSNYEPPVTLDDKGHLNEFIYPTSIVDSKHHS